MDTRLNWVANLGLENLTLDQVNALVLKIMELTEEMGGIMGGGFQIAKDEDFEDVEDIEPVQEG